MDLTSVGMFKLQWPVRKVLDHMFEDKTVHNVGVIGTVFSVHIVLIPQSKTAEFTSVVNTYLETIRSEFSK